MQNLLVNAVRHTYEGEVLVTARLHESDLIIDVVSGRGGMFSLDNGREKRFLTRSTVCAVPAPSSKG